MLVLSRRVGEKIVAPRCALSVTVIGIQGNRVRLGISAPPGLAVVREELLAVTRAQDGENPAADSSADVWDALVAELSDTAYQIAMRRHSNGSWMELEMDVWQALTASVKKWTRGLAALRPASEAGPEPELAGALTGS